VPHLIVQVYRLIQLQIRVKKNFPEMTVMRSIPIQNDMAKVRALVTAARSVESIC
jgi:hypothetical protein